MYSASNKLALVRFGQGTVELPRVTKIVVPSAPNAPCFVKEKFDVGLSAPLRFRSRKLYHGRFVTLVTKNVIIFMYDDVAW
jgi:hypothetical protein